DTAAGVEVVVHRIEKMLAMLGNLRQRGILARIKVAGGTRGSRGQLIKALSGNPFIAFEEAIELFQANVDFLDPCLAVVDRATIVGREQEEPDGFGSMPLKQLTEGAGAFGLTHFAGFLSLLVTRARIACGA